MMTDENDKQLERMQSQAPKYIYGWQVPYGVLRSRAGVTILRKRRVELCDKFVEKCLGSEKYKHWFPERNPSSRRSGRTRPEPYLETFARCNKLRNSPLLT